MATIGFVTTCEFEEMPASDRVVANWLATQGHRVVRVDWESPVQVSDVAVLRSTWNYHLHIDRFRAFIEDLAAPLLNEPAMVRWNMDKRYLVELAAKVPVVPTTLLETPTREALAGLASEGAVVVKPTISASAHRTFLISNPGQIDAVPLDRPLLVQPFVDSVQTIGEFSLMFFDGVYSHAIVKRPQAGDFRTQEEHGGRAELVEPEVDLVEVATAAVRAAPSVPVYARVDLVRGPRGPMLMELELIEPEVYNSYAPESAERFGRAILGRL